MPSLSNLPSILPGVFCSHPELVMVHDKQNAIVLSITPKQDCETTCRFLFQDDAANKQYHIETIFNEPHARIHIRGLYHLQDHQSVDIQTTTRHVAPHCTSQQIWKGVLHDTSRAKLNGKIIVEKNAQKTSAHLTNRNLLLSKTAEIQTKPILEIYADDVQCTHGATVGCLDQAALFYCRARGIDETTARAMLIQAFIDEI